uniref:single-stranded DNA cytosine deaminase n=1 Tax=Sus scrofa TaxID=9823 RepID=A0A8D0NPR4_PIG
MSHISRVLGPVWLVPPLRDRAARRPSQETAPTGLDPRGCGRQQVLRTLAEGGCWNEWMSRRRWERMMMQEKMGGKGREEGLHHGQQASRLPPRAPHPQPLRPPARPHGPPLQPRVSPFRLPLCQVPPDPPCHAELCFLSWFQSWGLSPDEHYYVTWFIYWSPCCECAAKVAQFLEENRNVSLSLSAARLYYFWKSESREGLRRLSDLGAQVGIMSFQDFQHCWNNFVHNLGMPFQPWKKLHKNYQRLVTELKQILRNTMNLLKENIFKQQFGNQPRVLAPYYLRKTYLCYQVKGPDDSILDKGCFQNKKKRHAEIRFIDKINSLNLDQNQCYRIICYVTWSPCHNCAKELVDFISNRHHLSLQLFASRLYFHWVRCYQRGLQRLQANRVSVAVMKGPEFKDCWEKFVDHQGESFPSWEKLEQYSESISRRLSRILRFANQNNLEDSFRDLRLGSPSPSSSRSDSR